MTKPMNNKITKLATSTILFAALIAAFGVQSATRTQSEILAASKPTDWRVLGQSNLLYMQLPAGRVVFELAPEFAPKHVENIKTLAGEKYWDNLSVYRVQDNFVTQFGDPNAMDSREAPNVKPLGTASEKVPAEFDRSAKNIDFWQLPDVDGWAPQVGFSNGFAVGKNPETDKMWLAHCYGILGAGRFMEPDSSTGAELYMVIGQSPRQLDLNITTVGRVIQGAEFLSGLKRGPAPAGIYADKKEYVPIEWIRLGTQLPSDQQVHLEMLKTNTQTFADVVEARRNRVDDFYLRAAGHVDLCNIPVPIRNVKSH